MNWNMALWSRRILPAESQEETTKSLRAHGWNNKQIISGDCCVENIEDMYVWKAIKKRQGVKGTVIFMLKRMQPCKQGRTWSPQTPKGFIYLSFPKECLKLCLQATVSDRYGVFKIEQYKTLWVRERTIPTERPPLVGEVSANFCG
jgi:hypothetical protein